MFQFQDTSAITVFGTLLMLAINQNHQEMVVAELRTIFETADSDVTPSHLIDMKYTERVIKETMRLLPPGERIIQIKLSFSLQRHTNYD